jgi:hypothetical protein
MTTYANMYTPSDVESFGYTHTYWRDGQDDLQGAAALAAATTDLGQGEGDDDHARHAPLNLELKQHDLRLVIVRAKQLKVDMYAALVDDEDSVQEIAECMSMWITPFNSLIMDAQDDLKQGIDAISKIYEKLEAACDEWEEDDSESESDNTDVS